MYIQTGGRAQTENKYNYAPENGLVFGDCMVGTGSRLTLGG